MRRAMRRPKSSQPRNVRAACLAVSQHVYWRARLYVLVLSIYPAPARSDDTAGTQTLLLMA